MAFDTSKLAAIYTNILSEFDAGIKDWTEAIGDQAQQDAPEDTGALKASKVIEVGPTEHSYTLSFGRNLPDARAVYQEYGTSKMPAQPYLTPATTAVDGNALVTARVKKATG